MAKIRKLGKRHKSFKEGLKTATLQALLRFCCRTFSLVRPPAATPSNAITLRQQLQLSAPYGSYTRDDPTGGNHDDDEDEGS